MDLMSLLFNVKPAYLPTEQSTPSFYKKSAPLPAQDVIISPLVPLIHLCFDDLPAKIQKDSHSPVPSPEDPVPASNPSLTYHFGKKAYSKKLGGAY